MAMLTAEQLEELSQRVVVTGESEAGAGSSCLRCHRLQVAQPMRTGQRSLHVLQRAACFVGKVVGEHQDDLHAALLRLVQHVVQALEHALCAKGPGQATARQQQCWWAGCMHGMVGRASQAAANKRSLLPGIAHHCTAAGWWDRWAAWPRSTCRVGGRAATMASSSWLVVCWPPLSAWPGGRREDPAAAPHAHHSHQPWLADRLLWPHAPATHRPSTAKAFMRSRLRPVPWAWSSMRRTEAGPVRPASSSWASNRMGAPAPASTNSNLGEVECGKVERVV